MLHLLPRFHLCTCALVAALLLSAAPAAVQGTTTAQPVVVELYTSQGCSSCPPADELLGELATWPGVIALGFHVDYWDYIGWKDPFAKPAFTERQRAYQRSLGGRYVYTPQIIVDGRSHYVGSRRGEVKAAIAEAQKLAKPVTVGFDRQGGGRVVIARGLAPPEGADVWLAVFDAEHETEVRQGENTGRQLKDYQVVRMLAHLGFWSGEELAIPMKPEEATARGHSGCAVIVQDRETKAVLGAALLPDD